MKYKFLSKRNLGESYVFAFKDSDGTVYPIHAKVEQDDEYPSKIILVDANDNFTPYSAVHFIHDKIGYKLLVFDNENEFNKVFRRNN